MKLSAIVLFLVAACAGFAAAANQDASGKIEQYLERGRQEMGVEANPPIGDEVFLRRIYLDVIGRVPTLDEAKSFLASADGDKRSKLIDELLESEGYVSHFFNYWSDILRVNESIGNNRLPASAHALWLKQALRSNKPYDEFVRDMITARGYIWENGAVGYYQRDRGMQLDNMSNTVRIFLGTRLECAQCHNHPFDKWTQMDYYEMAAFSYGMDARDYNSPNRQLVSDYQREMQKKGKMSGDRKDGKKYSAFQASRRVVSDLYNPVRYIASTETERDVRLPHDYQYGDAKPKDEVEAAAMFGTEVDLDKYDSRIEAYGDWFTSPDNPRFTLVIANRLWKEVMGVGLIEPVDELMDATEATNPQLMEFLVQRMKALDYDMKAFLRELYNTPTYQREADDEEILPGMVYYFPGPKLRRLSAEQMWDSLVALAVPEPDFYMPNLSNRLRQIDEARQIYNNLEDRSKEDFLDLVKKGTEIYAVNFNKTEELQKKFNELRDAKKEDEAREVGRELSGLRNDSRRRLQKLAQGDREMRGDPDALYAVFGMDGEQMKKEDIVTSLPQAPKPEADPEMSKEEKKRFYDEMGKEITEWRQAASQLMRASELPSPAPRGHFLREFGQSDREVIENASDSASVPQALNLLNGTVTETLTNRNSVLQQNLSKAETPEEKVESIYLSMLTRLPDESEMNLLLDEVKEHGAAGYENIVWALVNSQNFRFVQ